MKNIFLAFVLLTLTGCASWIPFPRNASKPPEKLFEFTQTEKQVPKVFNPTDGLPVLAYETEKTYSTRQAVSEKELSFSQKVGRWIGGLTFTSFLFLIISLLVFGGAPIIWVVKKYYDLRGAFKNTVKGIKSLPPTVYEETTDVLAKTQNTKDKQIVDKLKSELH